jgi:hypothetical protein
MLYTTAMEKRLYLKKIYLGEGLFENSKTFFLPS